GDRPGVSAPQFEDRDGHGCPVYVIQVNPERITIDRAAFIERLIARNIGVSVHFIPLNVHPYYRDRYAFRPGDFPNAFAAYERILSLPIYAKMEGAVVRHVLDAVRGAATGAARRSVRSTCARP